MLDAWTQTESDHSGLQYFTNAKVGLSQHEIMLDGGSGVNSTTEEIVVRILNENTNQGISLGNPRHPIKALERWGKIEGLRGVAGSKVVPIIGAVVLRVDFIGKGKENGPYNKPVYVRFKVCKAGSTYSSPTKSNTSSTGSIT